MDISFALDILEPDKARTIITKHPPDYLLFASDSPWTDQAATLELLARLELEPELYSKIWGGNAQRLFNLQRLASTFANSRRAVIPGQ